MVVALRDVRIRGEIRTIVDYVLDMVQVKDGRGEDLRSSADDQEEMGGGGRVQTVERSIDTLLAMLSVYLVCLARVLVKMCA